MSKVINVAIDGPAGAGKSTISRAAAAKLGYIYIDTGALYRTVGVNALRKNADVKDSSAVISTLTDDLNIELRFIDGEQRMFLNGEDVSKEIRTPEASMAASAVSAVPEVRSYLWTEEISVPLFFLMQMSKFSLLLHLRQELKEDILSLPKRVLMPNMRKCLQI